jgi:ATP-dependent Clp protease ATP-binding subunit ClpC
MPTGNDADREEARMFDLFTDEARRVVVQARDEALRFPHSSIGTHHILLSLLHDAESPATRTLASLGVSREVIRARVEESVPAGESPPRGHIPFTPGSKIALEHALSESRRLGHEVVGPEHILLGLISEGDGIAAHVLAELGVDLPRTRGEVSRLPAEAGPGPGSGDVSGGQSRPDSGNNPAPVAERGRAAFQLRAGEQTAFQAQAEENERLRGEVRRLRALLRDHGIDPGDPDGPTAAP